MVELSDADVFGVAPARGLSDAEVFGAHRQELSDEDVFGEGRPLTNAQARAQLPRALTEAEAPLPPIQHVGDTEPVLDPGTGLPIIVPPQPAGAGPQSTGQGPVGAIASKAAEAWGTEPIGMTEQTADALRRAGILPVPGEGLQPLKQANEAALRSLAAAWDVFARGGGAGFAAFQETLHQAGLQMGLPETLARDIAASPEAFFGMPGNMHAERGAFEARNAQRAADMGASGALSDIATGHPETPQTMSALPTLNRMAEEAAARRQPEVAPENTMTVTARRPDEAVMPERAAEAELERTAEAPEVAPEVVVPEAPKVEPEAVALEPVAPNAFDNFDAEPAAEISENPPLFTEPAAPVEPPPETAGNRREPITPYEAIPKEPERLSSFIKRMGGVQDVGGDIRHSLGGSKFRPGLINKNGLPLDEMTMRAWQSGYFPDFADRPSINDLRDAIDDDVKGRARYSAHDDASVAAYEDALAKNNEVDRLAVQHDIPTTGITRDQFFDQLHEKLSVEEQAALLQEQAAAHEDAYKEFETAAKDWYSHSEPAPEGWNAKNFYGQSQARTLKDLEDEYRQQEAAANAAQQRAEGVGEPRPAAADQGAGEEGGGPRPGGAGAAGSAGAQAPAADLLGRPLAEPRARTGPEPTIRNDVRQDVMPGMEPSATQAQAARDAGRGTLQTDVAQKPANEGLFAPNTTGQGTLYSFPGMLFEPEVWRRAFGPLAPAAKAVREASRQVTQSIADGLAPIQGGTKRAQAFAADFANSLRRVQYRYGEIDREIERNFTPAQRDQMGRALDAQSVFEQTVREMPEAARDAARAEFDAGQTGLAGLNEKQRQAVDALDAISQDVWNRMQERGLVAPNAQGLPYYMPRQVLMWSEAEGFQRAGGKGGAGRGLEGRGANLTTQGPMRREHLTPEETEAAAQAKLGPGAVLLRDIRSLPARLAFSERAIAGVDLMNAIEKVGKDTGVDLVVRGDIPGMLEPGDFFTMADHPSFRKWTGTGWQAIHVAKEFEGPLKAVLTKASPTWYKAAQMTKGGVMSAIMFSPFIHLAVELGRALPVMPGRILTLKALRDGSALRRDLAYMDQATRDGLAPLGQGWAADPASIADQALSEGRSGFLRSLQAARDAVATGAGKVGGQFLHDVIQHPHQTLLWDQVFNLQVGIYDAMRNKYIADGYQPDVAGTMAAHLANRYAGALPPEHLSRSANMAANLLLFSRSFTLGNLGVMKDMLSGAPSHIRARIEQMAGSEVAQAAQSSLRRKAISAFVMDIGLFYIANGLLQAGLQQMRGEPAIDDWLEKAGSALESAKSNPLSIFGVLPQHWNEPGKQDRVYAGTDSQGKGIYLRLPPGKVGEEFLGWFAKPGTMLVNKASPLVRPIVELLLGYDSLGRQLLPPHPETIGDYIDSAGAIVKHIGEGLGPTSTIQGLHELYQQHIEGKKTQADPLISALKVLGPLTGAAQISQGYPGGPAAGEVHAQTEKQRFSIQQAMPAIRQKIRDNDLNGAMKDMTDLGVPMGLQRYYIRQTLSPGTTPKQMRQFQMTAPPEALERLRQHTQ